MKNNTKLIMETWRRFLKEGSDDLEDPGTYDPYDGMPPGENLEPDSDLTDMDYMSSEDPFDRVTQGPDEYIPDEGIIEEIVDMLNIKPHLSPEDIKNQLGMDDIDEEIGIARERYANSQMTSGEEDYDPTDDFEELF